MNIVINQASAADLPVILALLEQNKLPVEGVVEHANTLLAAREEYAVIGCAALELYGPAALLRSVAVRASYRGQGIGQRLTQAALDLARDCGVQEVYLLTETAGEFFPRFGFAPIPRDVVPETVQQSVEFTSACPVSALVMRLRLG